MSGYTRLEQDIKPIGIPPLAIKLLGLVPGRELWGLEPLDLGGLMPGFVQFVEVERPWWYALPCARYTWDDAARKPPLWSWSMKIAGLIGISAYLQLGTLVLQLGAWPGILAAVPAFMALFSLGCIHVIFGSTLVTESPLHHLLDGFYLLLLGAACISLHAERWEPLLVPSFPRFLGLCFLYWTVRYLEGAVLGQHESVRRFCASRCVDLAPTAAVFLVIPLRTPYALATVGIPSLLWPWLRPRCQS